MRRLSLHASALNDEEYKIFTDSIIDLAISDSGPPKAGARDDAFYEGITVSVREVRAWLRGRYMDIPVTSIDTILKFFAPALAHGETLSGGQFFAVLRLVVHVQNGKEADRALAFVQAHPTSPASLSSKMTLPACAAPPQSPPRVEDSNASSTISEPSPSQTNPFSSESRQQPPLHPSHRQELGKTAHSPHNPFVTQHKPASTLSENGSGKLPPLPPRKPPVPTPPPRHAAVSSTPSSRPQLPTSSLTRTPSTVIPHAPSIPPIPPKPRTTHFTSTLIKQSLQASKAAQTMKKAEEQLEKERVLQVLRSSSVVSGSNLRGPYGSRSPTKKAPVAGSDSSTSWSGEDSRERPPLPRRRHHQQQPSPPMSASSLEQVALAVAPSGSKSHTPYSSSPFESPETSPRARTIAELPGVAGLPPPTHPDRKPYGPPYQTASTSTTDEPSPFKRNLGSFEAAYGSGQLTSESTSTTMSMETPTTPTAADISGSGSPSSRMYRSKSLHHHSHPPPPPPPVRRRRPESVQLVSNGEALFGSKPSSLSNDSPLNNALKSPMMIHGNRPHRRSSLSGGNPDTGGRSDAGVGGTDSIQRTLVGLQLRAESALPKLEAARYKAEAGLSRRGYIKGEGRAWSRSGREDRENLMSRQQYDNDDDEGYGEDGDGEDRIVSMDGGGVGVMRGREKMRERDELKWPAGEGWRML